MTFWKLSHVYASSNCFLGLKFEKIIGRHNHDNLQHSIKCQEKKRAGLICLVMALSAMMLLSVIWSQLSGIFISLLRDWLWTHPCSPPMGSDKGTLSVYVFVLVAGVLTWIYWWHLFISLGFSTSLLLSSLCGNCIISTDQSQFLCIGSMHQILSEDVTYRLL